MTTESKRGLIDDFVKFKPLTQVNPDQLRSTFEHMARSLSGAALNGTARFQLLTGSHRQSFTISMHDGQAKVEADIKGEADLEVITTPETWLEIAQGNLAPLTAFTRGLMRVRGNVKLGQRIMKQLAAQDGRVDFC